MKRILLDLLTVLSYLVSSITSTNYCAKDSNHILCGNKGISKACGNPAYTAGTKVSEKDKRDILRAHNTYRNKVAAGKVSVDGGFLPTASNMQELEWDDELAALSEAYVKECLWMHSCGTCAILDRFKTGESLHLLTQNYGSKSLFSTYPWERVIHAWSENEEKYFPVKDIVNLKAVGSNGSPGDLFGHLTQLMWGTTKLVGCGRIVYKSKEQMWEVFSSCHYGPGGNILASPVYRPGTPCSACEGGMGCSTTYPQLCSSGLKKKHAPMKTTPSSPPDSASPHCITPDCEPDLSSSNILKGKVLLVLVSALAVLL